MNTEEFLASIGDEWVLKHLKVGEYAEEESEEVKE